MGNNWMRIQAMINGVVVSVIDCAVGAPVGTAVLTVAKVTLRPRSPAPKLQPRPKA